ncbi:UPF0175 family protein [Candidatus Kuenenia sp.]|uniref:UPF0175 family protein n=1 Tax=Candidatus Kuenenia sp. TaxID=2499824 RepID=UPI00321FBC36
MEAKLKFPDEFVDVLEKPVEKSLLELIAVGLYRDGRVTLRQVADILGVDRKGVLEILKKHNAYINYGIEELKEDIAYASGGE